MSTPSLKPLAIFCAVAISSSACTSPEPHAPTTTSPADELSAGKLERLHLSSPRAAHSATLLANGKVLIAGGCTLPGCDDVKGQTSSAELFDPATGRFEAVGPMSRIRISQMSIRLPDGDVLLIGGYSGIKPTATSDVYITRSRRFVEGPGLPEPRADGTATALRDGRILLAGGANDTDVLQTALIFDPRTGDFEETGPMTIPRYIHTATLLSDGLVLIAGGATTNGRVVRSAEVFDPATEQFTAVGQLAVKRYKHGAALLPDGRVLIIGGAPRFDLGYRYTETEIFDPLTEDFTSGPESGFPRYHLADAVATLPSGAVVVAGGAPQIEVVDPAATAFHLGPWLGHDLSFATATTLDDGTVLVVGGYNSVSEKPSRRAWVFRPSPDE